jgi:hypothetical protein
MATRTDFTDEEWVALQRGATGSAMLVSMSDRDFTDTFGEVGAMSKYMAEQQVSAPSELVREIAKVKGSGFGLTTPPDKLRVQTMDALKVAQAALAEKSPADVEPYRELVLGVAEVVARAKGGRSTTESVMIAEIRQALMPDG